MKIPWIPVAVLAIGGFAAHRLLSPESGDTSNYEIIFPQLEGWDSLPPGAQQLFRFQDPESKIFVLGSISRVIDPVNPTPELDTDGLAEYYLDVTRNNFDGWTAVREPDARGRERFSVIRREGPDRTTITAYSAKGNTTLVVSIGANGESRKALETHLPVFREFLGQIQFRPKEYQIEF